MELVPGASSHPPEKKAGSGPDPDRLELLSKEIARLRTAAGRWSLARLAAFAALLAGAVAGFRLPIDALIVCPPALIAFVAAVLFHSRTLGRTAALENERLLRVEAGERRRTRRRAYQPPPVPPNPTPLEEGRRVHLPEPPSLELDDGAADDLGVLKATAEEGRGAVEAHRTLLGFLDYSSTIFGARRLRRLLLHPLREPGDIQARQAAVAEAAAGAEARERLLLSLLPLRRSPLELIGRYLGEPAAFADRKGLRALAHVLGTAAPVCLIGALATGNLAFVAPLLFLLALNFVLIGFHVKQSNPARDRIVLFGPLLEGWLRFEAALSATPFAANEWKAIRGVLVAIHPHARRLLRYVRLLELHSFGPIFEAINILTLWELRILPAADATFNRQRQLLEHGVGAIAEAEAILCLALPLGEQEGFEMPEVVAVPRPFLRAAEIGHPLLEYEVAVRNPISLGEGTNVLIVTGSNMSGKSTYLKSVALNLLLASAGGPACTRGFRCTPLALHTDINVRDSLDDGKSYFQVEVERVLAIVRRAQASPFLLAVVDELFRGTNSEERIALACAILRYLRTKGALVIAATHDLALTRLVTGDQESGVENRHFRESVEGGVMRFDYRLREGPADTRNAIRILETQGYPEEIIREARERAR